jgi:hypothetical protein
VDFTVNLFTSFGYFDSDAEHTRALGEMVATVRRGGWFALDFLNAARVPADLVPREDGEMNGESVRIDRWLDPSRRHVFKSLTLPEGRRFVERVRLFSADELERFLEAAGCAVSIRLGDYDGVALTNDSPRVLLAGRVT